MSWIDIFLPKKMVLTRDEADKIEKARREAYVQEAVKLNESLGKEDARRQFGRKNNVY